MLLTRRRALLVVASAPLAACGKPKTPLAHLYGQGWVHGAYEYYGKGYRDLQVDAKDKTFDAYQVIAQRGVTALDGLQAREVPFHIRVDTSEKGFLLERDVPDRLTFRADMTDADRKAAQAAWEKAREHIQTDYAEIRRLDWSLTRLLSQLQRVRAAIENTKEEQFRLVRQVGEVREQKLPFELPYEVTAQDYETILYLLIARLDEDTARLKRLEANVAAVGLVVRATDAGSSSLAANARKVLLAVATSADDPPEVTFPADPARRDELIDTGKKRRQEIALSDEYKAFLTKDRDQALDQLGSMLGVLDRFTGLPTSKVYRIVMDVWRGDGDYFGYLRKVADLVPGVGPVAKTLDDALGLTEKLRKTIDTVAKKGVVKAGADLLVNTGTDFAKRQLDKQLVFFKNDAEAKQVESALADTPLMKQAMPKIEALGGASED